MSKANSPIKVLRTALKRVDKSWAQNAWVAHDDKGNYFVCLEGAVYGYCSRNDHQVTSAQNEAIKVLEEIISERYQTESGIPTRIPDFNDKNGRTKEEVMEVIKLGIIRLETDALMDDDDFEDLLEHKERTT